MTSLKALEGVGDKLINTHLKYQTPLKDCNSSNIKSEGWAYESQRNVVFSQEIMEPKNVILSPDVTLVASDEPNIITPCLIHDPINSTKIHQNDSNSQYSFLCCDYGCEQEQKSNINCCCFHNSSTPHLPCVVTDKQLSTRTYCFCTPTTNNNKKTNITFYSR